MLIYTAALVEAIERLAKTQQCKKTQIKRNYHL